MPEHGGSPGLSRGVSWEKRAGELEGMSASPDRQDSRRASRATLHGAAAEQLRLEEEGGRGSVMESPEVEMLIQVRFFLLQWSLFLGCG